jgi:hypothetical protein
LVQNIMSGRRRTDCTTSKCTAGFSDQKDTWHLNAWQVAHIEKGLSEPNRGEGANEPGKKKEGG